MQQFTAIMFGASLLCGSAEFIPVKAIHVKPGPSHVAHGRWIDRSRDWRSSYIMAL
jgi:hypothetical protein